MDDRDVDIINNSLGFLDKISSDDRQSLLQNGRILNYKKGDGIQAGADECKGLIVVLSGSLRAYMLSEGGREITLYRLHDGDVCIMTASCVIKGMTYAIMIQSESDSRLFSIPADLYRSINERNIDVQQFTNDIVSSRFSEVMWVMEQVLFISFDRRLATFLIDEAERSGTSTINMTHDAIARHLGSAREVVTRMLKYFRSEGMIELKRGSIIISDVESLRRFVS